MTQVDVRMARRIVGYLEYGKALEHLDQLVSMSSPEELDAIDTIISDRSEFTIYTRLPANFDNPVSEGAQFADEQETAVNWDVREKRGLPWVIALARVEFGAIIAGFTDHPDPYALIKPGSYAGNQTMTLLLEGVASHYDALQAENKSSPLTEGKDGIFTALAWHRRIRTARMMMQPLARRNSADWTSTQKGQLTQAAVELTGAQEYLTGIIRQFLAARSHTTTQTFEEEFSQACSQQLAAMKKELAAGTAKITSLSPGSTPD